MAYKCQIHLDSVNTAGDRLTTFEITYPRFVHSEFMTHRMFSRNAASSRAIPIQKMIQQVLGDPAMPLEWGKNQKGMQAREVLDVNEQVAAKAAWLDDRDCAVRAAKRLHEAGVHKQIVNRLLEPFSWITVLVSATEYDNFFKLRNHPDAQPELRHIASIMQESMKHSAPRLAKYGDWHLPMVQVMGSDEEEIRLYGSGFTNHDGVRVSAGRCARISYLTHDGKRDPKEDIRLHNDLVRDRHWSPLEHQAYAAPGQKSGNFTGWIQYRQMAEYQ